MGDSMELELSGIYAHDVDQRKCIWAPSRASSLHAWCCSNRGIGTSHICSECVKIDEMFSEKCV